jgi:hypothetical protein
MNLLALYDEAIAWDKERLTKLQALKRRLYQHDEQHMMDPLSLHKRELNMCIRDDFYDGIACILMHFKVQKDAEAMRELIHTPLPGVHPPLTARELAWMHNVSPYRTHFILSLLGDTDMTGQEADINTYFAVHGDGRLGRVEDIEERPLVKDCFRLNAPVLEGELTALQYALFHDLRCCVVWLEERTRSSAAAAWPLR